MMAAQQHAATMNKASERTRFSEDGKSYWDGEAWVPYAGPSEERPDAAPRPARTGGMVVIAGAVLTGLGTLLPYEVIRGSGGVNFSRAGVQTDGIFVLVIAFVPAIVAGAVLLRRPPGALALGLTLVSAVAMPLVLGAVAIEILRMNRGLGGVESVNWGLGILVSTTGAMAAVIGVFVAWAQTGSISRWEAAKAEQQPVEPPREIPRL
jgi:hypothetical protein